MCLLPALMGLRFDSFSEWQAAVGAHRLEDFESVPDLGISPHSDGVLDLPGFDIAADAGEHSVRVADSASDPDAPPPSSRVFIGDTHGEGVGQERPTYNDFLFPKPIRAFAFEVSYAENPTVAVLYGADRDSLFHTGGAPTFYGVVLDRPVDRFGLRSGFSVYHVDNVRWASTPEPSSFLVFCVGLAVLRGTLARRSRPR